MTGKQRLPRKAALAFFTVVLALAMLPASAFAAQEDTTPPELISLTFDKPTIEAPGTITVTATVSDDISGVDTVMLWWDGHPSGAVSNLYLYETASAGTYSGTLTIGAYESARTQRIRTLSLSDNAGNSVSLNFDDEYTFTVVHLPITIGTQSGKLTAGTAGSASFAINTANIATPSAIALVNVNNVPGIALATASLTEQDMDITISTTADTPAGAHTLQLTIGNVTSLEFTLTVDNPVPDDSPPTVATNTVTDITASGATVSGNVISDGGAAVTERGFVYSTSVNPAIGGAGVTQAASGDGTGTFTANISGLTVNTTYHVRAYATNSDGTAYGADVTFATLTGGNPVPDDSPPTVATNTVTNITASGATVSGNVTSDGGAAVTERGFVYGTSVNPAIGGAGVTQAASGDGTGTFTANISGLTASTTYHLRAYATNSEGTSYGSDVPFTTLTTSGGSGGGGGGGGSSGSTNTTETPSDTNEDTASGNGTSTATISATTTVSGNTATATVSDSEINDSIETVTKEAGAKGTTPVVEIKLDPKSADTAQLNLTADSVGDLTESGAKLKVNMSELGTLTFDSKALEAISAAESADSAPVTITAEKLIRADLPEALQNAVKPTDVLLDFSVKAGDATISNLNGGTVDVTVPYTVSSSVKPATVVAYHLDAQGNLQIVLGRYDDTEKTVNMTLKHFSKYLIRVNAVAWDVTDGGWHTEETMDFAAARGLLDGYIIDGKVSAGQGVTRGDFTAGLLKALGISPLSGFNYEQFDDVDPGDPNALYIRTARELGIVSGVGANKFESDRATSRGEQFQVIMNLINTGYVAAGTAEVSSKKLEEFSDAADVANWLKPAIQELIRLGIVEGDGTSLMVNKDFTVGETAVLFERLS
jgi:hypothetical protein